MVTTASLELRHGPSGGGVRVRTVAIAVGVMLVALALTGSFAADNSRATGYVATLSAAALVVLVVSIDHPSHARAWRLVGGGLTLWALGGLLVTLQLDADVTSIPDLSVSLCYTLGYIPLLIGVAELADPNHHTRRITAMVDGALLFLMLYAVLWLLVVEQVMVDSSLPKLDRAFSALYPAGDLALVMLSVRLLSSQLLRRRVGALLLAGFLLSLVADMALLVLYLHDPTGAFPLTDLTYLIGLGCIALASVWSLLPVAQRAAPRSSSRRLAQLVAATSLAPPLVLGGIVLFTDRNLSIGPIAVWISLAVCAAVLRHVASVRELEQAHEQALWLASHDPDTDMLYRTAFMHQISAGGFRDRSGTVVVVEALGLDTLRATHGYDAVDHVMTTLATQLRNAVGDGPILGRLAHDQLTAFMRSADLARGRQVADGLQRSLASGTTWCARSLPIPAIIGVSQADGAVIDALAGLRRAIDAVRIGRSHGAGFIAIDADLTGSIDPPPSTAHPSRHHPDAPPSNEPLWAPQNPTSSPPGIEPQVVVDPPAVIEPQTLTE